MATCSCPCGETRFELSGAPLLRFLCHCRVCQEVYRKPFADVVVVRDRQLLKPLDASLEFRRYRPPPSVLRSVCAACRNPVVARAPMMGLAFMPTRNLPAEVPAPAPALHVFYHRRAADVEDELPKVSGYWASEWAVVRALFPALLARR